MSYSLFYNSEGFDKDGNSIIRPLGTAIPKETKSTDASHRTGAIFIANDPNSSPNQMSSYLMPEPKYTDQLTYQMAYQSQLNAARDKFNAQNSAKADTLSMIMQDEIKTFAIGDKDGIAAKRLLTEMTYQLKDDIKSSRETKEHKRHDEEKEEDKYNDDDSDDSSCLQCFLGVDHECDPRVSTEMEEKCVERLRLHMKERYGEHKEKKPEAESKHTNQVDCTISYDDGIFTNYNGTAADSPLVYPKASGHYGVGMRTLSSLADKSEQENKSSHTDKTTTTTTTTATTNTTTTTNTSPLPYPQWQPQHDIFSRLNGSYEGGILGGPSSNFLKEVFNLLESNFFFDAQHSSTDMSQITLEKFVNILQSQDERIRNLEDTRSLKRELTSIASFCSIIILGLSQQRSQLDDTLGLLGKKIIENDRNYMEKIYQQQVECISTS